ncbi:hypothetical protein [Hydrogenophaga sp. R2]|uniref:hypothetical protein n=1 Tax=Hydrogenophaga sp. R2 TaxID=3132827 RepID=UPI003CE758BB
MSHPTPPPAAPERTWTKSADRPLRSGRKSLGIWCMARALGVPVPWAAVRQTDGVALLAHEHARLQALAAAGERVPAVLAFDGQHLVTSDIGTTLDRWLDAASPADRLPVMCRACADLASFHARGQWHGGSQTRNLTWDGVHFARLDFEERLVPGMPLDLVQRYDAVQLLLSMTRHLEPLGPGAVLQVLQAYAEAGGTHVPDLRPFLARLLPRLRTVLWLVGWSPRLRHSREARRLRTVLDGMTAFVADRAAG